MHKEIAGNSEQVVFQKTSLLLLFLSVAPIIGSAIRYWPILANIQQFNCIGIGISMTNKQILVVRMRITQLMQIVHCWL